MVARVAECALGVLVTQVIILGAAANGEDVVIAKRGTPVVDE